MEAGCRLQQTGAPLAEGLGSAAEPSACLDSLAETRPQSFASEGPVGDRTPTIAGPHWGSPQGGLPCLCEVLQ